jgi:hypothetical protein
VAKGRQIDSPWPAAADVGCSSLLYQELLGEEPGFFTSFSDFGHLLKINSGNVNIQ